MSLNFSANQYERSFRAERLGNWEVNKWYPHIRPRQRKGHTKIIADDRGHLLPGVRRIEPWGHFRSTWQLPRRITRNIAAELNAPRFPTKPQTSWEKRSSHIPLVDPKLGYPSEAKHSSTTESKSTPSSLPPAKKENRIHSGKKEIPVIDDKDVERLNDYQPYDKDEHDFTHPMGCDGAPKVVDTTKRVGEDIKSYTENCRALSEKKTSLETLMSNNGKNSLDVLRANDVHKGDQDILEEKEKLSEDSGKASSKHSSARSSRSSSKSSRRSTGSKKEIDLLLKSPPLITDFISSQYSRDLAQDNLKHQPLPDTVHHEAFKALQMKKSKHPGTALENLPQAVAVGHKKFVSPGPTQCSKLNVYRPKTAGEVFAKGAPLEQIERPKTCRIKDLHEIDLALCWDLVPDKPEDEPKRPAHIDGSNGSIAPSVFAVIKPKADDQQQQQQQQNEAKKPSSAATTKCTDPRHKPKTAWAENIKPPKIVDRTVNPSAVMDIINVNDDPTGNLDHLRRRPSQGSRHGSTTSLCSRKGSAENRNPNIPTAEDRGSSKKSSHENTLDTSLNSEKLIKRKLYSSSPNLTTARENHLEHHKNKSLNARPCVACDLKNVHDPGRRPKSDYKMAFKAGVPNSTSNGSKSGSHQSSNKSQTKPLSIPKPKTPFARKSYSIHTLVPPFSLWPGTTGMDYPEHWRLASVYQHSYKPIELRKKPLLQGVFH
ncbi:uncharacterized protein isoform X2 [Rhodnius prolixus]|uniref:uncharacterized protein isoform X2 n=1 Tax=Rhodnius prolixus TaxID=13249 RepID=UPI003D18A13E